MGEWNHYIHKFKYSGQNTFHILEAQRKQNAELSNSPVKTCNFQQVKGKITWILA